MEINLNRPWGQSDAIFVAVRVANLPGWILCAAGLSAPGAGGGLDSRWLEAGRTPEYGPGFVPRAAP